MHVSNFEVHVLDVSGTACYIQQLTPLRNRFGNWGGDRLFPGVEQLFSTPLSKVSLWKLIFQKSFKLV